VPYTKLTLGYAILGQTTFWHQLQLLLIVSGMAEYDFGVHPEKVPKLPTYTFWNAAYPLRFVWGAQILLAVKPCL